MLIEIPHLGGAWWPDIHQWAGSVPEHHEVEIIVTFDDVGDQPVTLLAYGLVLDHDVGTSIKVTAVMEGTRGLTVRRA